MVPRAGKRGTGCSFADRCARGDGALPERAAAAVRLSDGHLAACWNPVP